MARRPAEIPHGAWPPRMHEGLAAGFVGEKSVEDFLARVGTEYPPPKVDRGRGRGRRRFWLRKDLAKAIGLSDEAEIEDAADVL